MELVFLYLDVDGIAWCSAGGFHNLLDTMEFVVSQAEML